MGKLDSIVRQCQQEHVQELCIARTYARTASLFMSVGSGVHFALKIVEMEEIQIR